MKEVGRTVAVWVRRGVQACVGAGVALLLTPGVGAAATVTLAWDANQDALTAGYYLSYGTTPGNYTTRIDVQNATRYSIPDLDPAATYYFAVQAYSADGSTSPLSPEISFRPELANVPRVKPTGDLSGDAAADLVWQHDGSGAIVGWAMAGARVAGQLSFDPASVPDTSWKIVGRNDMNGDGKDDFLWQHRGTGALAVWLLDGTRFVEQVRPDPGSVGDLNWRIFGTGDLDGDGRPDLLWHHQTLGLVAAWLMNGTSIREGINVGSVGDTSWRVAAAGDLNHDGHLDLLWHHQTTGTVAIWLMDRVRVRTGAVLPASLPAPWAVAGLDDVDGDGNLDIIWQHRTLGSLALWVMNGTTYVRSTMLIPDQVGDVNWRITPR